MLFQVAGATGNFRGFDRLDSVEKLPAPISENVNSLVKRALGDAPYVKTLAKSLKGMTGVAFSGEEPGAAARVVRDFTKDNEKLKIKAGLLDGQVLDAKTVETQLATLPSKNEARAMLLATMMAPAQRFLMLLNTPAGNFVRLLEAKKAKG